MLKAAQIFGHYMVLQREESVAIWGIGCAGKTVTVEIQGTGTSAQIDEDGHWIIYTTPLKTSECETLKIYDDTDCIEFHHIAIGEVWLASGQSNMEFFMRYDKDLKDALATCNNDQIRMYTVPAITCAKMEKYDYSEFGYWRPCDADNLQYYSAVAYYFARKVQEELGVPVGIVNCNYGGTRACCWMDEPTVKRCGKVWWDEYEAQQKLIKDYESEEDAYVNSLFHRKDHPFENAFSDHMMFGVSKEELMKLAENPLPVDDDHMGPWHEWRPAGVYHTMLETVIPYTIKGAIWYQGESDETHPDIYADMMCGLIDLWRRRWNKPFPFIMTQLAPLGKSLGFGGYYYPLLRDQQELTAKRMPDVYCASIGDVGNDYDIHPKEKKPVGHRLALLALGHVYEQDILCDAPEFADASRTEERITLSFSHTGDGLHISGQDEHMIVIIDSDGHTLDQNQYTYVLENNQLIITVNQTYADGKIEILFAKDMYYKVNIYNSANIPVKPFAVII